MHPLQYLGNFRDPLLHFPFQIISVTNAKKLRDTPVYLSIIRYFCQILMSIFSSTFGFQIFLQKSLRDNTFILQLITTSEWHTYHKKTRIQWPFKKSPRCHVFCENAKRIIRQKETKSAFSLRLKLSKTSENTKVSIHSILSCSTVNSRPVRSRIRISTTQFYIEMLRRLPSNDTNTQK